MTTDPTPKPILVIGGGLAGLSVGRILTNAGIPTIVFEASQPERSQGFSISVRDWGIEALIKALGDVPLESYIRGVTPDRYTGGKGWIDQALRDNCTAEVLVAPDTITKKQSIIRANRNALRSWVLDQGDSELDVRYGHRLKSSKGKLGDVFIEFENGAKYHGALLIACDGVHSTTRSQILPHLQPESLPVVVYHGEFQLTRKEFDSVIRPLAGESMILAGVGDGFNTPITVCNMEKNTVHLDWSYSRPATGDDDPLYRPNVATEEAKQLPPALLEELESRNLAKPWSQFLTPEAMRDHRIFYWTSRCVFATREDLDSALEHGVVFAGDSWHAMPLFGGEGGSHSLLDAAELAQCLIKGPADLTKALSEYYDGAFKRCSEAVRRSRQRFFLLHRPMAEWKEIASRKKQAQV